MRKRKKRKAFLFKLFIIFFLVMTVNITLRFFKTGTANVVIPEGSDSVRISEILKENKLIQSKTYFLARLYISSYRGKLRYGTFKLDRNSSLTTIFKTLSTRGAQKNTVSITIPEGFSVEMIQDRLIESGLCTKAEFEAALKKNYDFKFLSCIPDSKEIKYRLQGFLYPETYEFYADASAETVISTMLEEFEKKISPLNLPENELFAIITKASLIEREAKIDSERSIIAGVIENRITANMRLQIDASVAYTVSGGKYDKSKILYKDLKVNSKYNTYKYAGLPAGPICCPSIKSISAASSPAKHKYLYYHTDNQKNDGSHIFTENYEEHTSTIK